MNPEDTQTLLAVLERIAVALEKVANTPVFIRLPYDTEVERLVDMASYIPVPHRPVFYVQDSPERPSSFQRGSSHTGDLIALFQKYDSIKDE